MQPQLKKQTQGNRNSRNNKKQHHATHEAGGHHHRNNNDNTRQSQHTAASGCVACRLCSQELLDLEKEFFPCNCKYKICQKCFWQHVDNENGKCPNCGLLYEVKRVKDYYASKTQQNQQLVASGRKKMRCDSPLPSSAASVALGQSLPISQHNNVQMMGVNPPQQQQAMMMSQGRGKQLATHVQSTTKQQKGQKNQSRQVINALKQSNSEAMDVGKVQSQQQQMGIAKQKGGQQRSSQQQLIGEGRSTKKQRNSSEQQRIQQKLNTVRILQRNTLYVIGLSPNVAKDDTLRRYEYFGQYGRILSVTINKEKAFQSENQGLCYSAYINYASEREASLSILAVDQFVFDGRLLHASYGRTKYCRFFLKGTNCLNHECPYLHKEALPENILTQEDMNKKILFQQCQQLALKLSKLTQSSEEQYRLILRGNREQAMRTLKLTHTGRIIMPQLEQIFDKKGLFKHCLLVNQTPQQQNTINTVQNSNSMQASANKNNPNQLTPFNVKQGQKQSQTEGQHHGMGNLAATTAATSMFQVAGDASKPVQRSAFRQHRGSEGCNSDMPSSNPNMMMMFGQGRMRLQSSGNPGELDFNNQNSGIPPSSQTRFQQLIPNGVAAQSRRFAQDDHYLTRVPPAYRLTANQPQEMSFMHAQQQQYAHRLGSPVPIASHFYFQKQQQFMPSLQQQQQNLKAGGGGKLPQQPQQRDSDKATQQSSSYLQPQRSFHQLGLMNYQSLAHPHQTMQDGRARSGSQAATAFGAQFEETKQTKPRRKSSDGKYRIFDRPRKESPSPGNKEEQRRFAEALREALQQFVKGGGDTAHNEGISTGHYSSIFTGGERLPPTSTASKVINLNQINCSEGIAVGQACSPIRDQFLHSRRNSEYLNRAHSQHSLIVESVARILDDTALEQWGGEREKQRLIQPFNEPSANQFDLRSTNSVPVASANNVHSKGFSAAKQHVAINNQTEHQIKGMQQQKQPVALQQFASPAMNNNSQAPGVWNKSNSLYNSPFFLIPTHTNNQQHRSAAFHDMSLRHLPQSNPFSFGGGGSGQNQLGKGRAGMVSDTWRLTHNPHPLIPRQKHQGAPQSSNLSSGGATGPLFRNGTTTKSDQEHTGRLAPQLLSRTVSQPFMMRSEQKVIRGAPPDKNSHRNRPNNSQLEMQQAQLTQRNLEILNKKYCPSKDMLYAKIFTDYQPSSPSNNHAKKNQVNSFGGYAPQHPISVQYFAPQSLFCFALDGDDSNELRQYKPSQLKAQKQVSRDDAAGILSTPSRRDKNSLFLNSSNHEKVKETSQTPTNKYSRRLGFDSNWNVGGDTRSHQNGQNRGKSGSGARISEDEIEMANQLANEASLGFGDLFSLMHSKSKKSQHGADRTLMSAGADCPPQRSRSQSYRDRMPTDHDSATYLPQRASNQEKNMKKIRHDDGSNEGGTPKAKQPTSPLSDSSMKKQRTLVMKNQNISQQQSSASGTTTGGQKSFYQEFVKVQEGFRKSSGLMVSSSSIREARVEQRRSSYSQGRNSSHRKSIPLMEVTRRGKFKTGSSRRSLLLSPLGLLKFKNHQIDEVAEDGATARDEKSSKRMNSADGQSYNLNTLHSLSRSRKESRSQSGRARD